MEVLERIFVTPFEVTQFWASETYAGMTHHAGATEGRLFRYCPEHVKHHRPAAGADWFFEVRNGEGGPFAGDFLPRILPTRNNIAALNLACIKASVHLGAALNRGPIEGDFEDDDRLFSGLEPYSGTLPMEVRNIEYQRDLWQVLKDDWGLDLPPPARFGEIPVTIAHRAGMPCAAAMVRAVLPIIEAHKGELAQLSQSTVEEHGRRFDVMEYSTLAGDILTQRFDITELWGRNDLDWTTFHF